VLADIKLIIHVQRKSTAMFRDDRHLCSIEPKMQTLGKRAANVRFDEGFSMRATARGFGAGLTLAHIDKPLKEEAVGC
jgi:hypothetical protein